MVKEVTCYACQKKFLTATTALQAEKEFEEYWGVNFKEAQDVLRIVCDPCFQKMHPKDHPQAASRTVQYLKAKLN